MSATTHMLERDLVPYLWNGDYTPILKHGGNKFPILNQLRKILSANYKIVLEISNIHSNLYVNGKPCLVRKSKFAPITVYPNCKILKGTNYGLGGSNSYPCITFKEGKATVEVITTGFPHLELKLYRMDIKILTLELA